MRLDFNGFYSERGGTLGTSWWTHRHCSQWFSWRLEKDGCGRLILVPFSFPIFTHPNLRSIYLPFYIPHSLDSFWRVIYSRILLNWFSLCQLSVDIYIYTVRSQALKRCRRRRRRAKIRLDPNTLIMKIYFCGSIRGGQQDLAIYASMIKGNTLAIC